ncbi:hypothetical protein [Synechococcus sp. PCC 7336]|uniref:hypothetical protein n=1 Tax=Synechococcus sp. PCC 7336 TaxID=195250 RepID=UPI0012EA75B0|nr:hypothetical protein [Synechococcus sp. PCC 7336]
MKHQKLRIAIGVLTSFIALTAIGGGIAMLVGAEGDRFPLEWLQNTPFKDYFIPALLLTIAVGGSSLLASVTAFAGHKLSAISAMMAGLIMVGFIVVEVSILKQDPPGPTAIEFMYFGLGLMIFGLAASLWMAECRNERDSVA